MTWILLIGVINANTWQRLHDSTDPFGMFANETRCDLAGQAIIAEARRQPTPLVLTYACMRIGEPA